MPYYNLEASGQATGAIPMIILLLFLAIWLVLLVGSGVAAISCLAGVFRAKSSAGRVGWFVGSAITGTMALGIIAIPLALLVWRGSPSHAVPPREATWEVDSTGREYRMRRGISVPPNVAANGGGSDATEDISPAAPSASETSPGDKPAWAIDPPDEWTSMGDNGHEYFVISAGPHQRWRDCEREFESQGRQVFDEYILETFQDGDFHPEPRDLSNETISWLSPARGPDGEPNEYRERITSPTVGPMFVLHRRLVITPEIRDELRKEHREYLVAKRLKGVTAGSIGVLALLTIVYGTLKWKHAPRRAEA